MVDYVSIVNELNLRNFRGIRLTETPLKFGDVTVIYGINGVGKTSIVFALSLLQAAIFSHKLGILHLREIPIYDITMPFEEIKYGNIISEIFTSTKSLVYAYETSSELAFKVNELEIKISLDPNGRIMFNHDDIRLLIDKQNFKILPFFSSRNLINILARLWTYEKLWSWIMSSGLQTKAAKILSEMASKEFSEIGPPIPSNDKVVLSIRTVVNSKPFYLPITDLGDGLLRVLVMILLIEYLKPTILIIDDIETTFNIITLKKFIKYILTYPSIKQIVLTTQSIETLLAISEFRIRGVNVMILNMSSDNILHYNLLTLEDALDYLEKGLDIRILPVGAVYGSC